MSGGAEKRRPGLGRGFWCLVIAQFLGAINDHYLKMVVSLSAIEAGLRDQSGVGYLSLSGIALVLPYLLFSGYAGSLADRFDKRRVLIASKAAELLLGVAVLAALLSGRIEPLIATLFLLGAQSVFFSPAKYGILPEILPAGELARANGFLEFGRYVAIIGGTVLGGGLMAAWAERPGALGTVVLVVALAGWLASLGIGRGARNVVERPAGINPWGELWVEARRIARDRRLRPLVAATTGFDFAVTLLLLAILLFTRQSLGLDELSVGLLAGAAGLGLGVGCGLVGRLSGRRIELAFVPIGALGSGAMFLLLGLNGDAIPAVATTIFAGGAFAGFVLVPLYAMLQRRATQSERGRVIATNNFLNMAGVLAGSVALWLLHDGFGVSPQGIFIAGGVALMAAAALGLFLAPRSRLRLRAHLAQHTVGPRRSRVPVRIDRR